MPISGEHVELEDFVAAVRFGIAGVDAADDVNLRFHANNAAMMARLGQVRGCRPLLQATVERVHGTREPIIFRSVMKE